MTTVLIVMLCQALGDRSFEQRETAAAALRALGPRALPALRQQTDDPHVRHVAAAVFDDILTDACGCTILPWIDMGDDPRREEYLRRVRLDLGYQGAPDWIDYRWATLLWVMDQLEAGRSVEEPIARMRDREVEWRRSRGAD